MQVPDYIKAIVQPNGHNKGSRRVWSIDLETVWVPFFTAMNTMEVTEIPCEALGAPLRLAHAKDGSVRFSQSGRPVFRVAKELNDAITLARYNYVARLVDFAGQVAEEHPDAYRSEVEAALKAAEPIHGYQQAELAAAIAANMAAEMDKAATTTVVAEAEAIVKAKPKRKAKAEPTPEPETVPTPELEAVTA